MNVNDKVIDIIERSNKNLEYIKEGLKKRKEVFEVTQLIANFITTLILCKENIEIDHSPISKYEFECEVIGENTYNDNFEKDTYLYIKHLRNACCHDGIEIDKNTKEIEYITFTDKKWLYKNGKRTRINAKVIIKLKVKDIKMVYDYLVNKCNSIKND